MRVTLDDHPCASKAGSVGEAIAEAAVAAEQRGRIVVEVIVDGRPWTDLHLGADPTDARDVSIVTADLRDLVRETLSDSSAALAEADVMQRRAAELIQGNRGPAALAELTEAIGIWAAVREAIVKASEAMSIDLDELRLGDDSIHQVLTRLTAQLRAVRSALQADDPVGLSDTLLYDMPEVVGEWRELLEVLRSHVGDGSQKEERES